MITSSTQLCKHFGWSKIRELPVKPTEKWKFHSVEVKEKEMIADKSNSLYIASKIKKQAHQYAHLACLHSDKPFQTKKTTISWQGR
jgi:hypothetical protein